MTNYAASQVITAILRPRAGKQSELLQMLEGLRVAISAAHGCVECVVAQDVSGPGYVLVTTWTDTHSLDAHLKSDQFGILRGAADVLGTQTDLRVLFGALKETGS